MNGKRLAIRAAWVAGSAAIVVAVGATSFCVALRAARKSDVLQVPDWTGRTKEDAEAEARTLGLTFEVAGERHDPAVSAGRILSEEPAPGTQVRRGRTIRATVSAGAETLSVPEITGQPSRQAELEVRRQGLSPGWETHVHDAGSPAGSVLDQFPPKGALAASGERVDRLVSDGPRVARYVMPDLTGRPLRVAQEWITLCGFRSGAVRRVPSEGRAEGTVTGQRPLAGGPIQRGDIIELTVAQ